MQFGRALVAIATARLLPANGVTVTVLPPRGSSATLTQLEPGISAIEARSVRWRRTVLGPDDGAAEEFELEAVVTPEQNANISRYGPDQCIIIWVSAASHCIVRTDCVGKFDDMKKYAVNLYCLEENGSRTRHVFEKGAFDAQETFDTLIQCHHCVGAEEQKPDGPSVPPPKRFHGLMPTATPGYGDMPEKIAILNSTLYPANLSSDPIGVSHELTDLTQEVHDLKASLADAAKVVKELTAKVFSPSFKKSFQVRMAGHETTPAPPQAQSAEEELTEQLTKKPRTEQLRAEQHVRSVARTGGPLGKETPQSTRDMLEEQQALQQEQEQEGKEDENDAGTADQVLLEPAGEHEQTAVLQPADARQEEEQESAAVAPSLASQRPAWKPPQQQASAPDAVGTDATMDALEPPEVPSSMAQQEAMEIGDEDADQ